MQLNINDETDFTFSQMDSNYEKIPENSAPIKVIKKTVSFSENTSFNKEKINTTKPKISYDDILSKMGMLVSDGKLHLIDKNSLSTQQQQQILNDQTVELTNNKINPNQNSYIYNKYFKEETPKYNEVRKPTSLKEYKMMLVDDYLQKQRIKQIKSNKLIMPTSNIAFSNRETSDLNKLFGFSKR